MRVYTEATPRLIELHRNYSGRKNVVKNYVDIEFFDNVNSSDETGYFWASHLREFTYNHIGGYTKLSEQEFIEFMGLELQKNYTEMSMYLKSDRSNIELEPTKKDNVNKPSHYTQGGIEPIDYILANEMNFLEGNVIKYVTRYKHKNGLEDLKKAEFYLKKLIEEYGKV